MKRNTLLPLAALLLGLAAAAGPVAVAAEDHHHHGDSSAVAHRLQLNAGKKWATDAALRQSMDGINQAVAAALPLIHAERFGAPDYAALAAGIRQRIGYAIEHCQLDAKADAMLHLVIADLSAGADMMDEKTAATRHDGALRVRQALESYGRFFQHPGWKVPRA